MPVRIGLDVLCSEKTNLVAGRRIGLVVNQSAATSAGEPALDAIGRIPAAEVCCLFSPEHGIYGVVADAESVSDEVHARSGLHVYSLFGDRLAPTPDQLSRLDALVIDLQDIGSRFYTYMTTLLYAMRAAAESGVQVIVCDRPNPIGGLATEGPILHPALESFLGPGPLPIRHGLTMGELAQLFNERWDVGCDLAVAPCVGWSRAMFYADTGLVWIPPSPAMPHPETAVPYPGTCLFEGTNLSEGRGTALPFEVVGAPWLDAEEVIRRLGSGGGPGVRFRATTFVPCSDRWVGERCRGIQVHVLDPLRFRPVMAGLALMRAIRHRHAGVFEWKLPHFDLLAGRVGVRETIDLEGDLQELAQSWEDDLAEYEEDRRSVMLY